MVCSRQTGCGVGHHINLCDDMLGAVEKGFLTHLLRSFYLCSSVYGTTRNSASTFPTHKWKFRQQIIEKLGYLTTHILTRQTPKPV